MTRSVFSILRPNLSALAVLGCVAGLALSVSTAYAEPPAAEGGAVTQIAVKNPLGMELKGTKVVDPKASTAEHTILAALKSQAGGGSFSAFLKFMHSTAKVEPLQKANLEAYQYASSKGSTAKACIQDGNAVVTVSKKDVNIMIENGEKVGQKIMVWCGEGRMPVPFTLYRDGDTWRFTTFGLN